MSQHSDEIRLRHMLDHAMEAVAMLRGKKRSDLDRNRMLELSLVRLVEIIGEAAARVETESKEKYPSIPWLQIVGMRNRARSRLRCRRYRRALGYDYRRSSSIDCRVGKDTSAGKK